MTKEEKVLQASPTFLIYTFWVPKILRKKLFLDLSDFRTANNVQN